MIKKRKYQIGGESTDFFKSIVDSYQSQQQPSYEEAPMDETYSSFEQDDYNPEYDELLSNYNDLQSQYDELMQKQAEVAAIGTGDTGDDFMNFLFSNKRNGPIDFSSFDFPTQKQSAPVGDKEQAAFEYFQQKGYPAHVAAGIVANIKHESNFNTNAVGDNGKARSLAQWHPDRYQALQSKGFDLSDFYGSLDAIDHELNTTEKGALGQLLKAKSAEEAAAIFDRKYERSAGLSTRQRMQTASNLYKSKYQVGGNVYKSQADVDAANKFAQEFARRKTLDRGVVNPEDFRVASKPGDPVVPFVDPQGRPVPPSPPTKKAYTVPSYVELSDIIGDGDIYGYEDRDGHWVDVDSSVLNLPRFRNQNAQIPVARTQQQQALGLNDPTKDEMMFPMEGTNTFRGLDSGVVYLSDEEGNKKILTSKYQTANMKGKVYEKKLKK